MKVEYEFDPFKIVGVDDSDISKSKKREILDDIADLVLTSVLEYVGDAKSPVKGRGNFKQLNKEYADKEHGGNRKAKLELDGDLLDAMHVKIKGDRLVLTIDEDQQPKADGHNNFSGDSILPTRRFVPNGKDGETFKQDILDEIKGVIEDNLHGV